MTLGIALYLSKVETEREALSEASDADANEDVIDDSIIEVEDITDNAKVSLLGYKLVALVQDENSSKLLTRITSVRKDISRSLGFVIPGVRVRDELDLEPNKYQVKLGKL